MANVVPFGGYLIKWEHTKQISAANGLLAIPVSFVCADQNSYMLLLSVSSYQGGDISMGAVAISYFLSGKSSIGHRLMFI
jgi:hypothetical protein